MRLRGIRTRTRGSVVAGVVAALAVGAGATACGGRTAHSAGAPGPGRATAPTTAAAAPTTPVPSPPGSPTSPGSMTETSSARLSPALLTLADLPPGFHTRPLTLRNLPSLIHGCPGLEELQQTGVADQAQGEWTRGALDAYVDEAVIEPRGDTAAGLVAKTAQALNACGSVQVVEEGLSVTLTATPLTLAAVGDASHAWHTTGKLVLPLEMNVVLIQQGNLVVLVAQTHVGGKTDDGLTSEVARAAARKAAEFQKASAG